MTSPRLVTHDRAGRSSVEAMSDQTKPTWERFGDAMLDWGGYLLLALATFLGVGAGGSSGLGAAWQLTTLAIAAGAAAWIFVMYTRSPLPRLDHRLSLDVFFVGLLVFASVMLTLIGPGSRYFQALRRRARS